MNYANLLQECQNIQLRISDAEIQLIERETLNQARESFFTSTEQELEGLELLKVKQQAIQIHVNPPNHCLRQSAIQMYSNSVQQQQGMAVNMNLWQSNNMKTDEVRA